MKKLILAIALLMTTTIVIADTMQVSWLHPVERELNENDISIPLLPEEIASYQLVINGVIQPELIGGTLQSVIFDLTDPGYYEITIRTVDIDGRTSADALPMVTHTVLPPVIVDPKPVRAMTIQKLN